MIEEAIGIEQLKPWGNPSTMQRAPLGYQIDWERTTDFFSAGKKIIKANGAASVGADAITVDAIPVPLRAGQRIDFGVVETVVVTLDAALINATTVGCDALSGPLPNGAILKTADSQEFLKLTAAAAEGAETLTVEAIPNALEGGETATFQGGVNIVEVLEDTAQGATSVPISNLVFGIADNAEGYTQNPSSLVGDLEIPEATAMALDATSKKIFPRRDADDEEIIGFLASKATNSRINRTDSRSGYGLVVGGTTLYENLLPDADSSGDLPSGWKTEIATNTLGFLYRDYTDSRAS